MSTILISGADADDLAARLTDMGHATSAASTVADLKVMISTIDEGSVDLYIQLPVRVMTEGANAVEVIGHFLREGLLRRFDAVSAVLPTLGAGSGTMLVGGNHPATSRAPDNPEARIALMKVLGQSVLLERSEEVSVSIVGGDASLDRVIELAQELLGDQVRPFSVWMEKAEEQLDEIPAWDYADWRNALLTMPETRA